MRRFLVAVAAVFLLLSHHGISEAATRVEARVDLSDQRMHVYVNGVARYTWSVSTGRGRYRTPTGSWRPTFLSRHHRSRKYDNAPMPFSVFFYRGYAVHGTNQVSRLGRPASHGCVRLHPSNASTFFNLVQRYGRRNVRIVVQP
jgi:lipoprotein-anchoring transpeptidase ErfK/SrfK